MHTLGVEGAFDRESAALEDMGIDHGGFDILVTQQFLDGANVVSTLQQVCRKRVTECMRGHMFVNLCMMCGGADGFLDDSFVNVMPAVNPCTFVH